MTENTTHQLLLKASRRQLENELHVRISQIHAKAANLNAKNQYLLTKEEELAYSLARAESN